MLYYAHERFWSGSRNIDNSFTSNRRRRASCALGGVHRTLHADETKSGRAIAPRPPNGGDDAAVDDTDWRKSVFEIALQQLMADPAISERTKQIFVRVAVKQESPTAVAQALGVSRNVVDQQKRRMLAKFKALVAALIAPAIKGFDLHQGGTGSVPSVICGRDGARPSQ